MEYLNVCVNVLQVNTIYCNKQLNNSIYSEAPCSNYIMDIEAIAAKVHCTSKSCQIAFEITLTT